MRLIGIEKINKRIDGCKDDEKDDDTVRQYMHERRKETISARRCTRSFVMTEE